MQFNKPFSPLGPRRGKPSRPLRPAPAAAKAAPRKPVAEPEPSPVPVPNPDPAPVRAPAPRRVVRIHEGPGEEPQKRSRAANARFRVFRSHYKSWEALFTEVAGFLTTLGPERVIGVSHSEDNNEGVVTVWYWS